MTPEANGAALHDKVGAAGGAAAARIATYPEVSAIATTAPSRRSVLAGTWYFRDIFDSRNPGPESVERATGVEPA